MKHIIDIPPEYWIIAGLAIVCISGYMLWLIAQPSRMVKEWEKQERKNR